MDYPEQAGQSFEQWGQSLDFNHAMKNHGTDPLAQGDPIAQPNLSMLPYLFEKIDQWVARIFIKILLVIFVMNSFF